MTDTKEMLTLSDISARTGLSVATLRTYRSKRMYAFPEASGRFGGLVPWWEWSVVEAWRATCLPKGRPKAIVEEQGTPVEAVG
jgi:predicted DNA-binding transcriptional regulator AlpA